MSASGRRMPVVLSGLLVVVTTVIGPAAPTQGAEKRRECRNQDRSTIGCGGDSLSQTPGSPATRSSPGAQGGPAQETADLTGVRRNGADAELCRFVRPVPLPDDPDQRLHTRTAEHLFAHLFRNHPECQGAEAGTGPGAVALSYWETVTLPDPDPYIAPGKAITGLAAYLETRGTLEVTFTDAETPFGTLEILAHGSYHVDWGDGTRTGPHPAEGRPWPDGEIRHTYSHVGTYDVRVEIAWTATWALGGESGVLPGLQTSATIPDFPVGQIQAVVVG